MAATVRRGVSSLIAGWVALLIIVGGLRGAIADTAPEPIRLEYFATSGCPDKASFLARLGARTASVRVASDTEAARTFSVRLENAVPSRGSVTVQGPGDVKGVRRLEAPSCDQVADALALMIALAVDPRGLAGAAPRAEPMDAGGDRTETSTPSPDASAPDGSDAGSPPALQVPDGAAPQALFPPPRVPPPPPSPTPPVARALPPSPTPPIAPPRPPETTPSQNEGLGRSSWLVSMARHFVIGADAAIATGVSPHTIVAGAPFIGWRSGSARLAAGLRLDFLRAETDIAPIDGGSADFTWTVGRLDGCAAFWLSSRLAVNGCARAEVGVLDVRGAAGIPNGRTRHRGWVAGGPVARVEWRFLGPLSFDVQGGPTFRLIADRYYLNPSNATVYQVAVVGLDAEAGLGLSFE